ncbi:hypothetical protein [Acaryochloris marina]|uniref:Uncharacterized protein n=1 Tax=Acaryochloris marina (strain MBIC 11017) TaxID=329726 RepID=A8ZQG2_ACAM1|nr:hypothetical protein [Acaryochloris marina]ABW33248.1 hypothetical protein AM1_G0068 [Acaryochloris marina MBIC11017]
MARKSKDFSELIHQKQRQEQKNADSFERLQNKVKEIAGEDVSRNMVFNPPDVNKMSEVLQELVAPYVQTTPSISELDNFLKIAVLAWNIALTSPEERQVALKQIFSEMASSTDQDIIEGLKSLVEELIERKDHYFWSCQRSITSFDLQDQGDSYFLSVASTLEE